MHDITEQEKHLVQRVIESWKSLDRSLTSKQKDEIGKNYLKHIVGADDKTISDFIKGELIADSRIGHVHAGINPAKDDHEKFWDEILPILTKKYSSQEQELIRKHCGYTGVISFLFYINMHQGAYSRVLEEIEVNMHAYK